MLEKREHRRATANADVSSDDEGSIAEGMHCPLLGSDKVASLTSMRYKEPRENLSLEDGLGPVADDVDPNSGKEFVYVLPLAGVLATASVGFLTLLSSTAGSASAVSVGRTATARSTSNLMSRQAFQWLVAAASVACLQSWTGMLYTYIRSVCSHFTYFVLEAECEC